MAEGLIISDSSGITDALGKRLNLLLEGVSTCACLPGFLLRGNDELQDGAAKWNHEFPFSPPSKVMASSCTVGCSGWISGKKIIPQRSGDAVEHDVQGGGGITAPGGVRGNG